MPYSSQQVHQTITFSRKLLNIGKEPKQYHEQVSPGGSAWHTEEEEAAQTELEEKFLDLEGRGEAL